jgi:hypothetical protein
MTNDCYAFKPFRRVLAAELRVPLSWRLNPFKSLVLTLTVPRDSDATPVYKWYACYPLHSKSRKLNETDAVLSHKRSGNAGVLTYSASPQPPLPIYQS